MAFHVSAPLLGGTVVSFPLAQTGEGISECELMQWFVKVRVSDCLMATATGMCGCLVSV